MAELTPQQRAGITKHRNTRNAFLGAADNVFAHYTYPDIQVKDIAQHSNRSEATFYASFASKSDWAIDVLDARLIKALDLKVLQEKGASPAPYERMLGKFALFEEVSVNLPKITQALIEERATSGASHSELLPGFSAEITEALNEGREHRLFRADMAVAEMTDFTIDSLALACAVRANKSGPAFNASSMLINGLMVS